MRNVAIRSLLLPFALAVASCGPAQTDDGTTPATDEPVSCTVLGTCDGGLSCCAGVCVDVTRSPDHCGTCGNDCSAERGFCASGATCSALSFGALCDNANLLALRDGNTADDLTTETLRDEVVARCGVSAQNAASSDASLVGADGQPLFGVGTTVVLGGGGFFQRPIRYVESTGVTPVYSDQVDNGATARFVRRSDGTVLATVPTTTDGAGEDWFVVYLVEEPVRGALMLAAYGFYETGTEAAGIWARDALFGAGGVPADTWHVVRWTDSDGTSGPSADDTFDVVDAGR